MSKQRARDQNPLAFGQPSPTSLGVRGKDGSKDKHEWLKQYSSTADQQALGISSPIPPSHSLNSQFFFEFLLGFYKKSGILASQAFFLVLKGGLSGDPYETKISLENRRDPARLKTMFFSLIFWDEIDIQDGKRWCERGFLCNSFVLGNNYCILLCKELGTFMRFFFLKKTWVEGWCNQ